MTLLQNLRSNRKYMNIEQTQKFSTAKTSKNVKGWIWFVKTLLVVFFIVVCLYICSLNSATKLNITYNIADIKDTIITKHINILMWTPNDWYPFSTWKTGQDIFIEKRCPYSNCFVTNRRDFFDGDLTKFDAIAFNARNLNLTTDIFDKPWIRSVHQKYIFVNTESSDNEPVCNSIYDGFFNWTATYKLNSDIVYSYIEIKNRKGEEVGPNLKMFWYDRLEKDNAKLQSFNKTKAVAWIVSNCATRNKREKFAENLKNALKDHNLSLDIFGNCGLKCDKCSELLQHYYFYLAFENSFAEDYVTEKLMTPLQNSNVPIVLGGADYSRFLPPGSYLDARKHSSWELAAIIARLIDNPAEYIQFFNWRAHYSYQEPDNVCRLCFALNNASMQKHKVYDDLRSWWNPDYKRRCQEFHTS